MVKSAAKVARGLLILSKRKVRILAIEIYVSVVEQADTRVSKTRAEKRAGSIPARDTNFKVYVAEQGRHGLTHMLPPREGKGSRPVWYGEYFNRSDNPVESK